MVLRDWCFIAVKWLVAWYVFLGLAGIGGYAAVAANAYSHEAGGPSGVLTTPVNDRGGCYKLSQTRVYSKSELTKILGWPHLELNVSRSPEYLPADVTGVMRIGLEHQGKSGTAERHQEPVRGKVQVLVWMCARGQYCVALGDAFSDQWRIAWSCAKHN